MKVTKKENERPDMCRLIVFANENTQLVDKRKETYGIKFGTVKDVARQYGIQYGIIECPVFGKCLGYRAPKQRLQMFAEKLHFSGVRFHEL